MKSRYEATVAVLALAAGVAGCGDDPNAATVLPTLPSPFFAQVDGRWSGDARLQPVEGTLTGFGECVQADVNYRVGNRLVSDEKIVLIIDQERADLAASLTSSSTGLSCKYSGKTSVDSMSLQAASCDAPQLVIRCSNDSVRTGKLVGSSLDGTLDTASRTITGTAANTYNLFDEDDKPVAGVVLRYNYTVRQQ